MNEDDDIEEDTEEDLRADEEWQRGWDSYKREEV